MLYHYLLSKKYIFVFILFSLFTDIFKRINLTYA